MTAEEAVKRLEYVLAHAWMIRQFLKHADEVQEDEEMLEVHRTIFDSLRAVEPSKQRGDHAEYLRRLRGKLAKLKTASEFFSREYKRCSTHTNFEMAALSLEGAVVQIGEILNAVDPGNPP